MACKECCSAFLETNKDCQKILAHPVLPAKLAHAKHARANGPFLDCLVVSALHADFIKLSSNDPMSHSQCTQPRRLIDPYGFLLDDLFFPLVIVSATLNSTLSQE